MSRGLDQGPYCPGPWCTPRTGSLTSQNSSGNVSFDGEMCQDGSTFVTITRAHV